ncbi:hypothetical protein ACJX0J_012376, partial [Zea mays]
KQKNEAWKHQIMPQVLASLYHVRKRSGTEQPTYKQKIKAIMLYGDMQSGSVYPFPPFITQQKLNNNHSYSFLFHHRCVDIFYIIGNRNFQACSLSLFIFGWMAERYRRIHMGHFCFAKAYLRFWYNYNMPKTTRDENKHIIIQKTMKPSLLNLVNYTTHFEDDGGTQVFFALFVSLHAQQQHGMYSKIIFL